LLFFISHIFSQKTPNARAAAGSKATGKQKQPRKELCPLPVQKAGTIGISTGVRQKHLQIIYTECAKIVAEGADLDEAVELVYEYVFMEKKFLEFEKTRI
jgi:hypothetical protein